MAGPPPTLVFRMVIVYVRTAPTGASPRSMLLEIWITGAKRTVTVPEVVPAVAVTVA
jgi:hypothetical protein